ncbi:MAG: zf-HC2 domain-containing protein [Candidatus Aminicenantes bacterium]
MVEIKRKAKTMKKCKYENLIDDYLMNRLSDDKMEEFELHYFNCSHCFEKMQEREEIISVIKAQGHQLFRDQYLAEEKERLPWYASIPSLLTPRQWAVAAASAALILIVILGVIPNLKTTSPQFFINEDVVRGESITLISPLIDINTVPSRFKWRSLGKDVEYRIYIYNQKLLWTGTTTESTITLPEEVKKLMNSDQKYSWQVKAFSPEGTLLAVSSRVEFKIISPE